MKTLTVRLPDALVADIEQESIARRISKSDVVRERLHRRNRSTENENMTELIRDLVGSVKGLPPDLSARKKEYLAEIVRSQKAHRR